MCIKDDCKNDSVVPNCMVVVTHFRHAFHPCSTFLLPGGSFSCHSLSPPPPPPSLQSPPTFFFFAQTDFSSFVMGCCHPPHRQIHQSQSHLWEACLEWSSISAMIHSYYNQLHAPCINARMYTTETKVISNLPLIKSTQQNGSMAAFNTHT